MIKLLRGAMMQPPSIQHQTSKDEKQSQPNPRHSNVYMVISDSDRAAFSNHLKDLEVPYSSLEIMKELGRGNFGIVNLAKYNEKLIAVKQLKADSSIGNGEQTTEAFKKYAKSMKEFVDESKVLAKIPPSPFVISLVGICAEPFSILTEYLDGGSLLEYLQVRFSNYF